MTPDPKYGFVIYEKMWLYHPVHAPAGRLFDGADVIRERLDRGWFDTPAKFKVPEVLARVDAMPDFSSMSKIELQEWLRGHGVSFAIRWGKDELIQAGIKAVMES